MTNNKTMIAYKGFDKNLCCRDKQYEIGKTYKHKGKIVPCQSGFHACPEPFDVFQYYAPGISRYCEVEISGETETTGNQIVCKSIKILRELTLEDLVELAVWRRKEEHREHTQGDRSISSTTGHCSVSSATGKWSASTSTGDFSASISTGYGSSSLAIGNRSSSLVLGYFSSASVTGKESIACAMGNESRAKASKGSWIALVERNDEWEIVNMRCGKAGVDIEPDTFYTLIDGEFAKDE